MKNVNKIIANLIINDIKGALNKRKLAIEECPIAPEELAEIAYKVSREMITNQDAKKIIQDRFTEYDNLSIQGQGD